jgi:hypothetical protein
VHHANLVILFHSLDSAQEEPELEAQVEPAKEADTEPEPEQGKTWCITPPPLTFNFNLYIYVKVNCSLG